MQDSLKVRMVLNQVNFWKGMVLLFLFFTPFFGAAENEEKLRGSLMKENPTFGKWQNLELITNGDSARVYYEKAVELEKNKDYDKALKLFEKYLSLKLKPAKRDLSALAEVYFRLGVIHLKLVSYAESKDYFNKTLKIIEKSDQKNIKLLYETNSYLGSLHYYLYDYSKALNYYERSKEARLKLSNYDSLAVGGDYLIIGHCFRYLGEYEKSINAYTLSKEFNSSVLGEYHSNVANVFVSLGLVYQAKMDFMQSLYYFNKALNVYAKTLEPDDVKFAIAYNNMGISYKGLQQYTKAEEVYEKSLEIFSKVYSGRDHPYLASVSLNLSSSKTYLGKYSEALGYIKRAIEIDKKFYGENNPIMGEDYGNLGMIYSYMNQHDSAIFYNQKALEFLKDQDVSPFKSEVYTNLVEINNKQGNYRTAVKHANDALLSIGIKPKQNKLPIASELMLSPFKTELTNLLPERGRGLMALYRTEGNEEFLEAALENYQKLAEVYKKVLKESRAQGSKLLHVENLSAVFEGAVECALEMYIRSGDAKFKSLAFEFAEESKAMLLFQNINGNRFRKFANIPDSVLAKEKDIKEKIGFYESKIAAYQAEENESDSTLLAWKNKSTDLRLLHEQFLEKLEKQYPEYFNLKYFRSVTGVKTIQNNLDKETAFLEFMVGEQNLYIFLITQNGFNILKKEKDPVLEEQVLLIIKNQKEISVERYAHLAFELYQKLLQPALDSLSNLDKLKKLIIIPDRELNMLSFETLLSKPADRSDQFRDLAFLIKDYTISYHYSASLMEFNISKKSNSERKFMNRPNAFLGFAPEFHAQNNPLLATRSAEDIQLASGLQRLPEAEKEVRTIANMLGGESLLGNEATEKEFKKRAGQAGIIHLATHAILNNENPMASRLVFSSPEDTLEDGLLHIYELYNMQLNASLVCLSACNTGLGKLYKGEGIISLARGFMYAGVPNVMMSLWSVPDRSTSQIMQTFYEEMEKGKAREEALRQAKLRYLESADDNTAHPYFWGAFIYLGDVNETQQGHTPLWFVFFLSGIAVLVIGSLYIIRKRSTR